MHFLHLILTIGSLCAGEPLPSVVWYRNERMIDNTDMKTFDKTVKNRIVISNIVRGDLQARYQQKLLQAFN